MDRCGSRGRHLPLRSRLRLPLASPAVLPERQGQPLNRGETFWQMLQRWRRWQRPGNLQTPALKFSQVVCDLSWEGTDEEGSERLPPLKKEDGPPPFVPPPRDSEGSPPEEEAAPLLETAMRRNTGAKRCLWTRDGSGTLMSNDGSSAYFWRIA